MRCNVGVNPAILADQHLIAEYYELAMCVGQLRKHNFQIKGPVNSKFSLGFAHMNFFKNKLKYLQKRKKELTKEMKRRGFNINVPTLDLKGVPKNFLNDWQPTIEDTLIIRQRIIERILAKPTWYRFHRKPLDMLSLPKFINKVHCDPLFYV